MEIRFGTILLSEKLENVSVEGDYVYFYDDYRSRTRIPIIVLVRLYELTKYDKERQGINFEEYIDSLFGVKKNV